MPMLRSTVFAAVIMTMASTTAMACLCRERHGSETFAEADGVFIGKVVRVDGSHEGYTTFEVLQWSKGNPRQFVTVSGSPCDLWFTKGFTYIVYAEEVQNRLVANSCGGTRVIDQPYEFTSASTCDNYENSSYQRIAGITALSVTFSISFGLLVGAVKRRFRK